MAKLLQSPTINSDKLYTPPNTALEQTTLLTPASPEKFDKNVPEDVEMQDISENDTVVEEVVAKTDEVVAKIDEVVAKTDEVVAKTNEVAIKTVDAKTNDVDDKINVNDTNNRKPHESDEITILPTRVIISDLMPRNNTNNINMASTNSTTVSTNNTNNQSTAQIPRVLPTTNMNPNGLSSSMVGSIIGSLNSNKTKPALPMLLEPSVSSSASSNVSSSTSSNVITIDDDEDIVITQVIKPQQPVANNTNATPARPLTTENSSLLKLASKIKSIVEPAAQNQPKLKQLQQTLAALITSKTQSSTQQPIQSTPTPPQQQQHQQQHHHHHQPSQNSLLQQQIQQQQLQQQQQFSNRSTQQQLQNLIQQALLQRNQAQQQAQQAHQHAQHHIQHQHVVQPKQHHVNNAVQQLISTMLSKQQLNINNTPRINNGNNINNMMMNNHSQQPSSSNINNNNSTNIPTSSNNNMSNLQITLKMLQEQLKNKYSKETPESRNELSNIISNIMNLKNMRNNNQPSSSAGTSGMHSNKLKSPSLLRQIQHAHRPKQHRVMYKPNNLMHMQQLQRKAPVIDLSQNIPVVHHSKEKIQFLSVVGLITRQEHQKIIISHAARKRRLQQARSELENVSTDSRKVRKRRRKDDADDDDTHDNYCSKCRMAGELLMCDRCPRVYHLFCVEPPLKQVPDGEWYCSKCKEEQEDMDVNVTDIMEDPGVDELSRSKIEELHRQLLEMKRVRQDLENNADVT